jgi:hypothetical protein
MLMLNRARSKSLIVILDNDLVNVLHAERRLEAAHERMRRRVVAAPHGRAPTFNASRAAATSFRAWMIRRVTVLGTR